MCAFNAARGLPAALSDRNDYTGRNGPYQSMGDTVAQAGRNVGEYASDVTHRVTETASSYASSVSDYAGAQAGERLMSAAEERGLTGEGFKEVAREVGDAFSDALSGEETSHNDQAAPVPTRGFASGPKACQQVSSRSSASMRIQTGSNFRKGQACGVSALLKRRGVAVSNPEVHEYRTPIRPSVLRTGVDHSGALIQRKLFRYQ
jgi:hypothetical protein